MRIKVRWSTFFVFLKSEQLSNIHLVHKLSINGKTTGKGQKMVLLENTNDPACPVQALTLLRMYCPPEQGRVFCHPATVKQKEQRYKDQLPYKSNPNMHFGEDNISKWGRNISRICGCNGWLLMTNHTIRGGLATIMNITDVSFVYLCYIFYDIALTIVFFLRKIFQAAHG